MTPPTTDRETWFLSSLELETLPIADMMSALRGMHDAGGGNAGELCELLEDVLSERGQIEAAIQALALRASWHEQDPSFAPGTRARAAALMDPDRERRGMVDHVGFDQGLPARECLRRLAVLLDLKPERICYDKTWGFGLVDRVDPFYKRVTVNFNKKRGHEMSFAYAAETLELIGEDHILAMKHLQPEALQALIENNPSDVVRMTLHSYGPLSVPALQTALVPDVLPEAAWKKFWDAARKELKQDPLVDIPAKRSEPIRLLDEAFSYDAAWFADLARERRIDMLLREIDVLLDEEDTTQLAPSAREILRDRLNFIVRGAEGVDTGHVARALMHGRRLDIDLDAARDGDPIEAFFRKERFLSAAVQLPARDLKALVETLVEHAGASAPDRMLAFAPDLPLAPLQEVLDALLRRGYDAECARALKGVLDVREASPEVLAWVSRNLDRVTTWSLGAWSGLLNDMLTALEKSTDDLVTRGRNQLLRQFEDSAWLKRMLEPMAADQRRNFLARLKETAAFEEMDRRSLLGRIVKLFPELQAELVARTPSAVERPSGRVTSERSFHERRLQLEQIVKRDIPNNSKEIAVARSYGDLRENHEFKAAKEMQAILLRRQGELEQMLLEVRPSDFTEFSTDVAGPGVGVRLAYEDGREEMYYILGEWDRDEGLGIISSTTRMAQSVDGSKPGDTVTVPSENGDTTARVVEVTPLPDTVRAWMEPLAGTDS